MSKFQVSPIANENCNSINGEVVIIATDSLDAAKWHASHNTCVFGAGILDCETGELDVGFGFGVPCPDFTAEG